VLLTASVGGVAIRLTDERWKHITARHPELRGQERKVLETIRRPDEVLRGDFGENLAVRFYRRTPVTSKHLVVPYKEITETDGFVLTAYFAARVPEWREQLWKR
jgi:hypothetical protein